MIDKKSFVFLSKFFAFFGFFQWLLFVVDTSWLQVFLAELEAGFLGLARNGNILFINGNAYAITPSCTGLVSAIVLGAIVFSLKKPGMKQKTGIFSIGVIVLFLVNIARVYIVLVAGKYFGIQAADLVHVASWFFMSGIIIWAWYHFTKKITGIESFDGFL
ncbi:MAG: exosortase/archaeosortase family protein [Candidatus Diapherotrites archaeon]|nr:exosortase/archaeosortase family protein [Candidatus Diapherotrites archaeon]